MRIAKKPWGLLAAPLLAAALLFWAAGLAGRRMGDLEAICPRTPRPCT
ncbi:hypothetical protein [Desulfohalovibrio reitneri]|nr:hypothetical protein [Desulfohalovibrio reitneri]